MTPIINGKKKPLFNPNNFKEFYELLPKIQKSIDLGVMREFKENIRENNQVNIDTSYIDLFFYLINKKWTTEIILTINYTKELYFNSLKRLLNLINTRTLVNRLKSLCKLGIIERIVHDVQPVRVSYKITQFGEDLCSIYTSIMMYLVLNKKKRKRKI
ncbi:MAG: winged helix-turn-helix transcriptional regulator [Promethearchaeota archaeon]